jgi:hypothetical protein
MFMLIIADLPIQAQAFRMLHSSESLVVNIKRKIHRHQSKSLT